MSTSPAVVVADRYRLVAPLGQGGMGRVWRAMDVVLHREVAIKELVPPPGLTPEERQEMRERSLREARAIARLNNINVVRIFDVLRTDGDPWIVMEYVPSRSLQDTLASDGPFTAVRAAEIGLGVLNALRAAHRNGVVHRDVKPGNVLIGAEGRVVLTDFGLATVPGDPNVTRTGLVLGSPAYIAPERARDGTSGPAADLWSLGATLYAAVEGASPFARPSAIATLAALATENPPPARNAGPLKPVLNGLLRKDPAHRINAEETERLLLRAAGRRSKLAFSMNPSMRRPGVGRERPALPGTPPVVPGRSAGVVPGNAAAGSAPVVPGPRPPIIPGRPQSGSGENRPPAIPGRPADGQTPVYTPGKATVGRAARPPDHTDRATRIDAPPVLDKTPNPNQSGTGSQSTQQRGESATGAPPAGPVHGALARGTRGVFGAIAPGAAQRSRPSDTPDAERSAGGQAGVQPPPTERPADQAKAGREASGQAAANRGAAVERDVTGLAGTTGPASAERAATDPESGESAAAEERAAAEAAAARKAAAEREALDRAAALWMAREKAATDQVPADRAAVERAAERGAAERAAGERATAQREAAEKAAPGKAAAERGTAERAAAASVAAEMSAEETAAADRAATARGAADGAGAESAPAEQAASDRAATEKTAERAVAEKAAQQRAAGEVAAEKPVAGDVAAEKRATDDVAGDTPAVGKAAEERAAARVVAGSVAADEAGLAQSEEVQSAEAGTEEGELSEAGRGRAGGEQGERPEAASASAEIGEAGREDAQNGAARVDSASDTAEEGVPHGTLGARLASAGLGKERAAEQGEPGDAEADDWAAAAPDQPETQRIGVGTPGETADPVDQTDREGETAAGEGGTGKGQGAIGRSEDETGEPGTSEDGADKTSLVPGAVLANVPAYQGPTRPAWQPMELKPRTSAEGLTVFGTTLTRRQTVIAGAIVLALILIVLVIVVPKAFGDGEQTPNQAGPTRSAQPSPSQTTKATATPSSRAAGNGVKLPADWHIYKDQTGFSVPVPRGWSIRRQGTEVYFQENGGQHRLLIVDQTNQPKPDPRADWQNQEAQRISGYRDYHRIRIATVSYWDKAADWEFTRTSDNGNPLHVVKRGFITAPDLAYGITWSTSADDWNANKANLDLIYRGFVPART